MKRRAINRKLLAVLLSLTLILSAVIMPVSAAGSEDGIRYEFADSRAGFATGKIILSPTAGAGAYYLYWADDEAALDGYYPIAALTADSGEVICELSENVAIPADASKVIAFRSDEEPADRSTAAADIVYDIPASKQNPHSHTEAPLTFEALSDTQLDQQSSVFYTYSMQHFAAALEDAAAREVDFITMSGDCINNYESGTSKEWQTHQKIIADSSYTGPIYETNGNHSMKSDINYGIQAYIEATGLGVDTEATGTKPWYELTVDNGDHFLFVALEGSSSVPTTDEFSDEQLDWLEATIQKYYDDGHHIFIFEHAFFHGWGPGDDKVNHYYSGGLRTSTDFPGNRRFLQIMNTYKEVFLYTGHSHLDLMYNWNYDNEGGRTANMFHIPSTACATHVTDGKLDYSMYEDSSQGYIVEVYDDAVITCGLDIVTNRLYPAYTYIVSTADYTHEIATEPATEAEPESETLVDVQINNTTSYLYSDGAAVFFYNVDSGNYFPVDSATGIAKIPENATNLTLYRCKGGWNTGEESKTDGITSYWGKYGPAERVKGQQVFYFAGSSNYRWTDDAIVYPATESPTEPPAVEPATEVKEATETTVYWAIPSDYADSGYTFRFNIRCSDNSYPHGAQVLTDTGLTYEGRKVYAYTFSATYTQEYDTLGINRIQLQIRNGDSSVGQYQVLDQAYTVSMLKDMIFISPDAAPTGTKTATFANFTDYTSAPAPSEAPTESPDIVPATEPQEAAETTVYWAIPSDYADSGYTFRFNIRCSDNSYPHGAQVLTDTGLTYEGRKVYAYTFSATYTQEYDTLGINRIQLQIRNGDSSVGQYQVLDQAYTVSMLKDMIFISPDAAPTGTKTATFANFKAYGTDAGGDEPTPTEAPEVPDDMVEISVVDATSSGWVYNAGAVLFLYDADTGISYAVTNDKAVIPAAAKHLTLYRCDGAWGGGNVTDEVTTYWNKWETSAREEGYTILSLLNDGKSSWLSSEGYTPETDSDYYLVGYFDGQDYGDKGYRFDEDGKLSMVFTEDSYVYILTSANNTYWTNGWLGNEVSSATLYRAQSLSEPDKLFVQSGKIDFTLVVNEDGSLTLSYTCVPVALDKSEIEVISDINAVIGDADGSGEVDIIDVTTIQRYLINMPVGIDLYAADVFGNGDITIMNATMIQRYLVSLVTRFPAEDGYEADVSTPAKLRAAAQHTLYVDYRYASYTAYSKLKASYFAVKDLSEEALEGNTELYDALLQAYRDFNTMKENNNVVTIYFCNDDAWSNVRAYCFNSETGAYINAYSDSQTITRIKTLNCGVKIYCITLNRDKWDKIIFMNSTGDDAKRTVDLDVPSQNYLGYYLTDGTIDEASGRWQPAMFRYCYDRI